MVLGIIKALLVLVVAFFLTTRVAPWLIVRALRRLGFKMQTSPVTQKRLARFRRIKRGYYSFLIIVTLFVTSLFLELLVNGRPLVVHYDGRTAFPAVAEWCDKALPFVSIPHFQRKSDFGQVGRSEVDYRRFAALAEDPSPLVEEVAAFRTKVAEGREKLEAKRPKPTASKLKQKRFKIKEKKQLEREAQLEMLAQSEEVFRSGRAWCVMPLYPYSPDDFRHELDEPAPNAPSIAKGIPFGTDPSGRDVFVLMLYGFRISLAFALMVAAAGYAIGITVGAIQGYYGGMTDIITQRIQEIWGSIPFLLTIMIIVSLVRPSFFLLVVLLVCLRSWLGITYYIRGEFYREKAKDYVQAAIGFGVSDTKIMLRHILPNALVPVVTFAPFGIVAYIGLLVSLDYLGFGLPPGTPSWGALLKFGLERIKFDPHLTYIPTMALASTLYCVVMIGEAVREAFDPKVFSRLR